MWIIMDNQNTKSRPSQTRKSCATVGLYLKDASSGDVIGVTNRHVTKSSHDGTFSVKESYSNNYIHFGRRLPKGKKVMKNIIDIDGIIVDKEIATMCSTVCQDPRGERRQCRICQGSVDDLRGKRVFKCFAENKGLLLARSNEDRVIYGTILPDLINDSFLVMSNDLKPFSQEGESGTVVALDSNSDYIDLVGIICGGKMSGELNEIHCTVCLSLAKCLEHMNMKYGKSLGLHSTEELKQREHKDIIQCGIKIYFDIFTPTSNVDLLKDILNLTCVKVTDLDKKESESLKRKENSVKSDIFEDSKPDNAIFHDACAEQATMTNLFKAAKCISENNCSCHESEKFLKSTYMTLIKVPADWRLLLICKYFNIAIWFYLENNMLCKAKDVLEQGLNFMKENETRTSFPKECLGFHYIDFAKYYMLVKDKENANKMAELSINCFRSIDECDSTPENCNKFILAEIQHIGILQEQGRTVSIEHCLKSIEHRVKQKRAVKDVDALLKICDDHFRKGNNVENFSHAESCQQKCKIGSSYLATKCIQPWAASAVT